MSRFIIPAVFFIMIGVFALVLGRMGTGEYNPRDIPTEFIGRTAPPINVPDLYTPTDIVRVADMKGKVWLFNVWGTWCSECWREHRYLLELNRRGIPIVGLNWREEAAEAKKMLAKMGNPFIKIGFDPESAVAIEWGVYGAPETFLVNAEGVIVEKHAGGITPAVWQQKFKKYFETATAVN